jgi:hypothetical protein
MPMRTVAILVGLVVLLGLATVAAFMPPSAWSRAQRALGGIGSGGGSAGLATFDPRLAALSADTIALIEVSDSSGTVRARVAWDSGARVWVRSTPGRSGAWLVTPSRPRGLAGILADVGRAQRSAVRTPPGGSDRGAGGDGRVLVRVQAIGGEPITFEVEPSVGGIARVVRASDAAVDGDAAASAKAWSAEVEGRFAGLFEVASIDAWAQQSALAELAQQPSQIVIESRDRTITLERFGSRWTLRAGDLQSRADSEAVGTLLAALSRFTVDPAASVAGIDPAPASDAWLARVRVITELPDPAGARRIVQEVLIESGAGAAGASGEALLDASARALARGESFDAAGTPGVSWGPIAVVGDAQAAAATRAGPEAFLSRVASTVASADVGTMTVARASGAAWTEALVPVREQDPRAVATFTVGATGWRRANAAGTTPEDARAIADLHEVLTVRKADAVVIPAGAAIERFEERFEITLAKPPPGGAPLEVLSVGVARLVATDATALDPAPALYVRRGSVVRVFASGDGLALLGWLDRVAGPARAEAP